MNRFPLTWPNGQRRTVSRSNSPFKVGYDATLRELDAELMRFKASDVVISTNVELRADGMPQADRRPPSDPGVAVYFNRPLRQPSGKTERVPFVVACDTYLTVAANLRAIGKTIENLRAIERYGSAQLAERAYTGFTALPPPSKDRPWHEVLGVEAFAATDAVKARYRQLAHELHPDKPGGNADVFAIVTAAYQRFEKERGL